MKFQKKQVANNINSINTIGSNVIVSLTKHNSKANAVLANLPQNSLFLKTNDVTVGNFIVGQEYKIKTIGTTDFTLIGASANTIGIWFTATGAGTGTGVATKEDLTLLT